ALPSTRALEREDGVGRLPALGWNSWNAFACNVNSSAILTAANEIVNLGLKDLGYEYVNIDDCWSVIDVRNSTTQRIIPDITNFPDGISGLADQIHDLGLKIGIYSSEFRLVILSHEDKQLIVLFSGAGLTTCAGYPASLGYEKVDAEAFAEWGIDYLKYDNCGVPSDWEDTYSACVPDGNDINTNGTCVDITNPAPDGYDWTTSKTFTRYADMRDALLSVNRTILYSLCDWGYADVNTWGNKTGNSWRISGDITANWTRIGQIANENSFLMNYVDFWGHPDPDMLEVNNGNLTTAENRAHFALWAIMKSPLIIGTALDSISDENLAILKNKYLLDFHQDPIIGRSARPYKWGYNPDWTFDPYHPAEYWSGPSSLFNGTLVLMLNSENSTETRTAVWSEVPELGGDAYDVVDAWSNEDLGCVKNEYSVSLESHDVAVLVVKGEC
ncbi:hypothetical protein N7495_001352, partial [Penicillium taxi]|uniref:uncharacterized protein n=1 Tax=Penicillium taxi TaxID=168475 RepID=UPI0025450E0F